MAVLVTGGAGFIGSHFIERLLAHSSTRIVCLDNFNSCYDPRQKRANIEGFKNQPRVSLVEASFCDREAMDDLFHAHPIDTIAHLGAYAGVRASIADPFVYEETNVRGTLVLLEMARLFGVGRFVFCSSSTVYGAGVSAPFREDVRLGTPLNPYAATKQSAELLAATYAHLHRLPVVCLRPFSVYGPRLRPDLAMSVFAGAILDERPLKLFGNGRALRDFTYVDDVCSGLLAALELPEAVGESINLGNNRPVEIRYVISLLEAALGKKARLEYGPPVGGEMEVTSADLTKAQRVLGYRPNVSLEEGIGRFVEWFVHIRETQLSPC